ncbi:MAG: carboxylating nicotinate-nucleotide diphosphorylase, partial [Candidatus Dormibacteria bacterium]
GRDLSTEAALEPGQPGCGRLVAREPGVVCGLPVAREVFRQVGQELRCRALVEDGAAVARGEALMRLEGPAAALLAGERVALNFVQRLSGIATLTSRFVARAAPLGVVILDTRKTTPGLRQLERYATRVGGARNHRLGLFDAVLLKDNHIDLAGGMAAALARACRRVPPGEVEVEVRTPEELAQALPFGVGRVLLDNFTPEQVRSAIGTTAGRCQVEVSGGVTLENLDAYLASRPDFISVGQLTHSPPALDVAMEVTALRG